MDDKKSATPGSQPDAAQDPYKHYFSEAEKQVADSIATYMQQLYPFKKACKLYEAIILTMELLSDVKAAGINEERAWQVLTLSKTIDCQKRG